MGVESWLSAIGHVVSDFFGGAAGGFAAEMFRGRKEEAAKSFGEAVGKEAKRVLMPDCDAIINLLEEMNNANGILEIKGAYQYENKVINLLLKVEEEDRQWVFAVLNSVCSRDRAKFFTLLEIMHNDGLRQMVSIAKLMIKEGAKKTGGAIDRGASGLASGLKTFREGLAQHGIKRRGKKNNIAKPKDPEWDF